MSEMESYANGEMAPTSFVSHDLQFQHSHNQWTTSTPATMLVFLYTGQVTETYNRSSQ